MSLESPPSRNPNTSTTGLSIFRPRYAWWQAPRISTSAFGHGGFQRDELGIVDVGVGAEHAAALDQEDLAELVGQRARGDRRSRP